MAVSSLPEGLVDDDVHIGFWTNKSLKPLSSSNLTLDPDSGGLLIAFLASYIATIARNEWKITRFLIYITLSTQWGNHDGIYQQRQAILRNLPLLEDVLLELLTMAWVWQGRRKYLRILPAALMAALNFAFTILTGWLSIVQ